MKKFIDKEKGRIVTVLNVDEAKKILEMYINYCLGKREVTVGRLNLVNYLGDFVKYSDNKDVSRFYEILVKDKETFEFSKNDLKAYESLVDFFQIYNNIEKGEFELNNVANYINSAMAKKQAIDLKVEKNEELNFEEKLNNIIFNKDFDLSILAKNACIKWEEILKQKIEQSENGIDVSLKEEIAYQDLLAICNGNSQVLSKVTIKEDPIIEEKSEEIMNEENQDLIINDESIINVDSKPEENIQININDDKTSTEETKEDEVVGPIIVNSVQDTDESADRSSKEEKKESDEEIIGATTIREATQDVSLREAAGLFNDAIDDLSKKDNNSSDNTNTSQGTLRDQ